MTQTLEELQLEDVSEDVAHIYCGWCNNITYQQLLSTTPMVLVAYCEKTNVTYSPVDIDNSINCNICKDLRSLFVHMCPKGHTAYG